MIKKMTRPLTAAMLAISLVSLTGCTQSNESAAGIEGVDPSPATGGGPPPKSQEEYMKQTQQSGGSSYSSQGYPGAR